MYNKLKELIDTVLCDLGCLYTWSYLITATRAKHNRMGVSARILTYRNVLLCFWGFCIPSHWPNPVNAPPLH